MFAYYRSSSYSTHITGILRGNVSSSVSNDLILNKGGSLEWMTVEPLSDSNSHILHCQLEQSTFGLINDTRLLHVDFESDDNIPLIASDEDDNEYQDIPYSKKTRQHSRIEGDDVIVVLSEYGKLLFMTIIDGHSSKRFETLTEIYIDSPGLEYTKNGKKLAVDPYARAIAVSSFQDKFDILILNRSMSRVHFDPIIGRGTEFEEGVIWHMEFLYTETDAMDKILLVLVIYNDVERLCRLVLYAIDASDINNVTIEKISRLPLEKNTPLPLLLIPLKFQPESLILVTEQQVCLLTADDLACGNVLYPTSMIPRPFGSLEGPLFTAYASHIDNNYEYLYLGSAEGLLYRLEVYVTGEIKWTLVKTTNPISQSMCVLGAIQLKDSQGVAELADVLVYAGESADSQVLAVTQSASPSCELLQTLINRAPLTDFQVVENAKGDSLITCSGQDTNGALCVINYGIEAIHMQSSKAVWRGISRLWNLECLSNATSYLVASSMLDTRLLMAKDGHIRDITASSNIDFEGETVYASSVSINGHDYLLQVVPSGLTIIDVQRQQNASIMCQWKPASLLADCRIELATLDQQLNQIALSIVGSDLFEVVIANIIGRDFGSSTSIIIDEVTTEPLNACPSYMGYFNIRSQSTLVLAGYDASLSLYAMQSTHMNKIQEIDLHEVVSADEYLVPCSAALVESTSGTACSCLLLGLRQGSLLGFMVNLSEQLDCLQTYPQKYTVGKSSVHLTQSASDGVYALTDRLYRVNLRDQCVNAEPVLLPPFKTINACAPFNCGLVRLLGKHIALIADDKLHFFSIGSKSQITTRKIHLDETPRKIVYDQSLNYIVAITTCMENNERKNYMRLIDPLSGQSLTERQSLEMNTDYGRSDMVLSTAEWSVKNKSKTYKYLCIGMGHPKEPFHSFRSGMSARVSKTLMDKGTLLLFRLKPKHNVPGGFFLKRVWDQDKLPGGVFGICPHSAGLLFSAGSHLYLYRLDPTSGRLVQVAHKPLQYLVTSIREQGGRICVTSHKDSVSFFEFDSENNALKFLKSDAISRSIHQSLMLNSQMAVGVSQSGGMVALYDDPEDRSYERRLQCLFNFHYADIVVKPSLANMHSNAGGTSSYLLPWTDNEPVRPITGCTVSGGIVQVYRIHETLYYLLHALQEIMLMSDIAGPLLGNTQNFEWYCGLSGRERATIHGDLVEGYLRLSTEEQSTLLHDDQGYLKEPLRVALTPFLLFYEEECASPVHLIRDVLRTFERYTFLPKQRRI